MTMLAEARGKKRKQHGLEHVALKSKSSIFICVYICFYGAFHQIGV